MDKQNSSCTTQVLTAWTLHISLSVGPRSMPRQLKVMPSRERTNTCIHFFILLRETKLQLKNSSFERLGFCTGHFLMGPRSVFPVKKKRYYSVFHKLVKRSQLRCFQKDVGSKEIPYYSFNEEIVAELLNCPTPHPMGFKFPILLHSLGNTYEQAFRQTNAYCYGVAWSIGIDNTCYPPFIDWQDLLCLTFQHSNT